MNLPKLPTQKYSLTLPSDGTKITYRPFTVGEQKRLLTAKESKSEEEIIDSIIEILENCKISPKNLEIKKLPLFDVELYFLKLRTKSISDIAEINIKHSNPELFECNASTPIEVDLNSITVEKNKEHRKTIKMNDRIFIEMRYLGLDDMDKTKVLNNETEFETVIGLLADSIEEIYDKESNKRYSTNDFKRAELISWLEESFSQTQLYELQKFFATYPKIVKKIDFTCQKCGQDDSITLKGIKDFFI